MGTKGAVGMLRVKLGDALKVAMKSNNRRAVSTLRLILAALKERDIAHRTQGADEEGVGEEEILKLLQSMIKQRRDSIDAYNKGGRKELAEGEAEEIEIINEFCRNRCQMLRWKKRYAKSSPCLKLPVSRIWAK